MCVMFVMALRMIHATCGLRGVKSDLMTRVCECALVKVAESAKRFGTAVYLSETH